MSLFLKRVIAYGIDGLVINVLLSPFIVLLINENIKSSVFFILFVIIFFLYFFLLELFYGKTAGKTLLNLQVENRNLKSIFKRTAARFIPLDLLSFVIHDENKLWHETLSGTYTIEKL